MSKSKWNSLRKFYSLYTAGLSRTEIERLLKRESADVLSFYRRDFDPSHDDVNRGPRKAAFFLRELFVSFLLKLTPARRLFYGVAFLLFGFGVVVSNWIYAMLAFLLVNMLLAFEVADKLLAKDELEIARDIQVGLQPDANLEFDGVEVDAFYQPAREVGGDYYDLLKIDDTRLAVIVGDVSGKGLPASLYAVKLQGLFESLIRQSGSPKEILIEINEIVCQRMQKQYFITVGMAIVDTAKREIVCARAGHQPFVHFPANGNEFVTIESDGLGIGLREGDVFSSRLEEVRFPYEAGDLLLLYTDGITEARNGSAMEYGESRLLEAVSRRKSLSASEIKSALVNELQTFSQRAFLEDDATLVILKTTAS